MNALAKRKNRELLLTVFLFLIFQTCPAVIAFYM